MDIKYIGHASFLIKTKEARIITDPFDPKSTGLKFPKNDAEIVTISHAHADHNATAQIAGAPLVIDWPGEFEKKGVRIYGFKTFHDKKQGAERGANVIYKLESEGIGILHCGDLGHILSDELIEDLGEIHVLMVPVGGFYTITAEEAAQLVQKIEPSIVIPMHYNVPSLNQEVYGKLTGVDTLLTAVGAEKQEALQKLTLKKEDLTEEMKVVVMTP